MTFFTINIYFIYREYEVLVEYVSSGPHHYPQSKIVRL